MRISQGLILTVAMAAGPGCGSDIIKDDFGTASYALVTGSVTRQGGEPFAHGPVAVMCGESDPTTFGIQASTDGSGAFQIGLQEPGGPPRDSLVVLVCRVSAGAPAFVVDTLDVPFTPAKVDRQETVVTLVEGSGA